MYAGSYGSGTTAENALNTALMQYPEIARTLIQQYPRYAATYLLERTGRFATEKVLGDNSFEWKVMGRYNRPSFNVGFFSTNGTSFTASGSVTATGGTIDDADANGDKFFLIIEGDTGSNNRTGDFLNKFDMVRFQSGATALVIEDPIANTSSSGASTDHIIKFEMIDATSQALLPSDIADSTFSL